MKQIMLITLTPTFYISTGYQSTSCYYKETADVLIKTKFIDSESQDRALDFHINKDYLVNIEWPFNFAFLECESLNNEISRSYGENMKIIGGQPFVSSEELVIINPHCSYPGVNDWQSGIFAFFCPDLCTTDFRFVNG